VLILMVTPPPPLVVAKTNSTVYSVFPHMLFIIVAALPFIYECNSSAVIPLFMQYSCL
jgi:hypothetical protein